MGYLSKYSGREVELILDNAIFDAPDDGKAYIRKNQDWEILENIDNIYSEEQALETFYTKEFIDNKLEETSNVILEEITKISDNLDSEIDIINKELISTNQEITNINIELTNTNQELTQEIDTISQSLTETTDSLNNSITEINTTISNIDVILTNTNSRIDTVNTFFQEETKRIESDFNAKIQNTNNKIEQQNDSILKMLPELNNVIITTQDDYDVMETYRQNCFYVCIKNDEIVKIYLGKYVIAVKGGVMQKGFPYTLPITF